MMEQRLGRYTLDDEIGRGGMAVVYRATDPVLERKVALKVLHPHLASREDARARFSREARAVARLQHPHIVEVFDYAPPESERAYIVTEYIDGPTLRAFVEKHPVRFPEVAALILVPVCEALGRAHEAGIVHRDVKPENIMIRPDGTPVLMDFGIAQMVDMETLTATGTMLGSPAHMAPEVIDGARVDHRSDLFSVGTMLYWLVCGALPFTAPNPAALFRRILEGRYDPVLQRRPHAGRRVARLIEQLMALDPGERPQTASEVADALRALLDEVGIHDVDSELEAFFADPEVYQDGLARRLLTAYVHGARRALDAKLTGRALDFIDRALALDDQDEAARALLARVERGRRRGAAVRGAATGALLVLAGLGAWALWPDDPPPGAGEADAAALISVPVRRADAAPPPDAAPPADAAPPDRGVDAAVVVDAAPDARPTRVVVRPRPPRIRRRDAAVAAAAPDAAVRAPARQVQTRIASGFKGAQVFVDGERRGYVYELQARGLNLDVGRSHRVTFRQSGCEPFETDVRIAPDAKIGPTIQFLDTNCDFLPARFEVASNVAADVLAADGTRLGRTNQEIPQRMTALSAPLKLTVRTPDGKSERRAVRLKAGEKVEVKVLF